jgi:hypothetical protein
MTTTWLSRLAVGAALAGFVSACASPEATRAAGGGPGADIGNRGAQVQMHEGSRPYWDTPNLIADFGAPNLEPARQAQRLSLRDQR